ncbi:MAG: maltooligosyltrehalose trehalohydrolase, partial [Frankiaceae bacterium]|nr:maltooligosyltrehalose trehalohydrolase [Frankiaceae bacterium]
MATYRVWAPDAERVEVAVGDARLEMAPTTPAGWWAAYDGSPSHGTDYAFHVDGGPARPDPRSLWQPHGVHGPSRT